MPRSNTIGIGARLGLDTKEAAANLKEYQSKFEAHHRAMTKITAIKLRPEYTPREMAEASRPQAQFLNSTRSMLSVNGQVVDSNRAMRQSMDQARGSSSRFGQGLMQLGYIADDAQYGLRGIGNNMGPLIMGMGLGAGAAGAVQILTTALVMGVKWWDEFSGATGRATRASQMMATETRNLAAATEEANVAGGKQLLNEQRRREGLDLSSSSNDRRLANDDRLRRAQADAEKAGLVTPREHLRSPLRNAEMERERIRKENEIDRGTEKTDVSARLAEARRKLGDEQKQLARIGPQVREGELRLEELRKEKATRDDALKDITERMAANRADGGVHRRIENQRLETRRSSLQSDNEEQARLEALIPGLRVERDKLDRTTLPSEITALEIEAGPEAAARERARQAKETAAQIEVEKAAFEEAGNVVTGALKMVAGEFLYLGQVGLMGMEKARREKGIARGNRDLAISEIRSPGRRRRAERNAAFADETKRLMEEEGLSPEAAADKAQRMQRVRDRNSGDRTIRGSGPARQFEGLEGFKRRGNFADRPLPDPVRERGGAALRRNKAEADKIAGAGGNAGDPGLKLIGDKLQQLIEIARDSAKTPAERQAPARRS